MDKSGWLPWPERKESGGNSSSSNRTGGGSWEHLKDDETVPFSLWPGTPDENWYAGAA